MGGGHKELPEGLLSNPLYLSRGFSTYNGDPRGLDATHNAYPIRSLRNLPNRFVLLDVNKTRIGKTQTINPRP